LGIVPQWAIYFLIYESAKETAGNKAKLSPLWASATGAMAAGTAASIATNPLWVVKARMQALREVYPKFSSAWTRIYQTEGIRGFYKGMAASLVGVSHIVVQFPLYEYLKTKIGYENYGANILVATTLSKVVASSVTYPSEVIRTRMQCALSPAIGSGGVPLRGGLVEATVKILRNEGVPALYRGMTVNMMRSVPASVLTIGSYEVFSRYLTVMED